MTCARTFAGSCLIGSAGHLIGMVTQSEITTLASGITIVGGAIFGLILFVTERWRTQKVEANSQQIKQSQEERRQAIETEALERAAITRDLNAEILAYRQEIHDLRDKLSAALIKLAVREALDARDLKEAKGIIPQAGPSLAEVTQAVRSNTAATEANTSSVRQEAKSP